MLLQFYCAQAYKNSKTPRFLFELLQLLDFQETKWKVKKCLKGKIPNSMLQWKTNNGAWTDQKSQAWLQHGKPKVFDNFDILGSGMAIHAPWTNITQHFSWNLSGWISSYRIIWTPISSCWPRPSDASQLSVGGSPPDFHICAFLVFHCAAKSGTKRRRGQRLCPFWDHLLRFAIFRVSHVTLKVQNRKQKKRTTGGARYCPGFISQFRRGLSSAQLALQLP